jgi:hypothetical protein
LCESVPDVPCNVRVLDAVEALASAVNVMVCAVPGVSVDVEGEAVTPEGKPLMVAETWPVKPLKAAAETLICVVDPAVKLSAEPGPERAKSAWLVAPVAVWVMEPEVADTVKVIGPGVTFPLAVIVTACDGSELLTKDAARTTSLCPEEPGVSVKVAGVAATPEGRPAIEKFTGLEKPLLGLTEIEMVWVEFWVTVMEEGAEIEKLGEEAEPAPELLLPELLPPQPVMPTARATNAAKANEIRPAMLVSLHHKLYGKNRPINVSSIQGSQNGSS